MDEATQDTGQLDDQLAALLEEIDTATSDLVRRVSDESPGLTYADLEAAAREAARAAEEARQAAERERNRPAADADDDGRSEATAPRERTPDIIEHGDADDPEAQLDHAIEEMLQDAVDETERSAASPERTQALDSELARLGDELLAREQNEMAPDGDIQAPESPRSRPADHDRPDEPPELERDDDGQVHAPPRPDSSAERPADEPEQGEDVLDAPVEATVADEPPHAPTQPASQGEPIAAPSDAAPLTTRIRDLLTAGLERVRRDAPIVAARARPVAIAAMAAASRPLESRSPALRSAIGWIAIVTAFWAVVALIYVVAIRDPSPPPSQQAPVDLVESASD